MSAFKVDIATRFQGATEDIYIIRPGEGHSLYAAFQNQNAVFLDFPDIRLPLNGAKPTRAFLREAVLRSVALSEWYAGGRKGPAPSRNPEEYAGAANGRRVGRYVAAVERLYYDLPEGTIIVIPGPGYFENNTLIGELVGKPTEMKGVGENPDEIYPVRRVRWIARRPKASFSHELRERLQKPVLMMSVERSLREEILKAAFDQYVIGPVFSSRLKTTQADFSTLDDFDIQTVVNCVCGLLVAVDDNKPLENVSLYDAIELLYHRRDLILEMAANINSPGDLRFFSALTTPLIVGVVFAIALASPVGSAKPTAIVVGNSAVAGHDPCTLDVQAKASKVVEMMDLDTWQTICRRAHEVHRHTGLKTSIKARADEGQQQ